MPSRYTWSLLKQPVRMRISPYPKATLGFAPAWASPDPTAPTWLGGIHLSSLGPDAVLPTYSLVLHILRQILEELAEGHVCSLVNGVVEQGRTPQERLLSEQHTVQAGQALLGGVSWPQPVLQSAFGAVPRLPGIVHTAQVVGACREDGAAAERTPRTSGRDS